MNNNNNKNFLNPKHRILIGELIKNKLISKVGLKDHIKLWASGWKKQNVMRGN